jgi:glucokinase
MTETRAIGLDIGGTNIRGALVDRNGNLSNWYERKTPKTGGRNVILDAISEVIENVMSNAKDVVGIGIGVAGLISHKEGIVRVSPNILFWKNEPLKNEIEDLFGMNVEIDNDSNLAGYGEAHFGAGKRASSLIMLTLGTGLGGGIILDNKIFRGKDNTAAEIGHMTIKSDGLRCVCGNTGCFEAYVSAAGIIERAKNLLNSGAVSTLRNKSNYNPENLTTLDICSEAIEGDKFSQNILDETGVYLGIGLSSLINLLNPEIIVIGGRIAECPYNFIEKGIEEAKRRTYGYESRMPIITKAKLGDRAGILGAGKLVFDYVRS